MPEVTVGRGRSFLTEREIGPVDDTPFFANIKNTAQNLGYGFVDENLLALGTLYAARVLSNEDAAFEYKPEYNIFADPQIVGTELQSYIGNFMHSNNAKHTADLIKRFKEKQKKIQGSPSYVIGRILGGLTDPSTILPFTKAGKFLITGSRLKRGTAFGGVVGAEELSKRMFTDERSMTETSLITAGGFIIPAMFPAIPRSTGKKFDDLADALDEADDVIFNKNTVGAASPQGTKVPTEDALRTENKIQPTGMGIFGEDGPFNPLFRVLKNGSSNAQEFIENVLEGPLYQIKNFAGTGKVTAGSIERNIYKRYTPTVLAATKRIEAAYAKYLQRNGANKQNFVERNFDTKFTNNQQIMSPKQFREAIWDYRFGKLDVDDEVIEASKGLDQFYKSIGGEYDELKIVQRYLEHQIDALKFFIGRTKNNKRKVDLQTKLEKLESKLEYVNTHGSLKRDNYTNIVFKKDRITANFDEFKLILTKALRAKNPAIRQDEIDDIVESFKQYQPFIEFENISKKLQLLSKHSNMKAADREILELQLMNKVDRVSSRFKSRNLNVDYRILADAGFIEKDINILQRLYYNQTIPDIEITKVFGDPMGFGSNYQKGNIVGMKQIADEYDEAIEAATSASQRKKLIKERDEILDDLDASIALVRGTYGLPQDPNRTLSRGIRIGKLYNSMTMLTGIAQTVDTARLVMINGVTKTFKMSLEVMTNGYAKETIRMSKNTTQLGGEALDMATSQRAMSMYGIDDAFGVFNKFEQGMSTVGNLYFTFLNLSNPWNTAVKTMAGMFNGARTLESIEALVTGGKITKVNLARLRKLGIDDDVAKEIYKQYQKHGYGKNANSWKSIGDQYKLMRVANSESWDQTPEAIKAAEVYHSAIGKQARIDIVTPSKGDVPLWANTELGGVLLQFKKFGLAATQRMLMVGLQERDINFLNGALLLLASGAAVDAFRQRAFNRSYAKKPLGQKLVDAFDRSGLGGIFSDVNNALERLTNNEIGLRPLLGAKKPYGTYRDLFNNPVPDVLGPSASQLANIGDIAWTWGTGKYNHHTARNVRRLLPFQNVWFLDSLFDEIEKKALR